MYNVGYDEMRQIMNFYNEKKEISDKLDEIEAFFLDIIEDKSSSMKVELNKINNSMQIIIEYDQSNLIDLSNKLIDIDRRFKRAKCDYKISYMYDFTQGKSMVPFQTRLKMDQSGDQYIKIEFSLENNFSFKS